MKSLLPIVALFLCSSVFAQVPGVRQAATFPSVAGTLNDTTYKGGFYQPTVVGDCELGVMWTGTTGETFSATDDGSNTLTSIVNLAGTTNGNSLALVTGKVGTASRNITMAATTGQSLPAMLQIELYNVLTSGANCTPDWILTNPGGLNPTEPVSGADIVTTTTPDLGTTATPAVTGEFVVACFLRTSAWPSTETSYTAGNAGSSFMNLAGKGSQLWNLLNCEGGVYNSVAALKPNFTWAPTAAYLAFAVGFKPATAGSSLGTSMTACNILHWDISGFNGSSVGTGNNNALTGGGTIKEQWDACGNALIVVGDGFPAGYNVTGITSSPSLTFLSCPGTPNNGSAGSDYILYAAGATPGTTYTLTLTMATVATQTSPFPVGRILAYDVANAPTTNAAFFDKDATNTGNDTTTTSLQPITAFTPSVNGEIVLEDLSVNASVASTATLNSGFTVDNSTVFAGATDGCSITPPNIGNDECDPAAHYNDPNTTALSPTWTLSTIPGQWAAYMAGFMPPASGPGGAGFGGKSGMGGKSGIGE
jgi:hypothetical protein